ncbi:MAG: winged helix-turn-helix domain-containing protein [Acidimicrobiia bacterium]
MDHPTVLLVEDEESFVEALSIGLRREGFQLEVARDGQEAIDRFEQVRPDVVLLDVMLPRRSGIDVCRELRRSSKVPIIMVTAKTGEIDAVVGLEVGADDYVAKPYRLRELVARIHAVLRRSSEAATPVAPGEEDTDRIEAGPLVIDLDRHEVTHRGEPVTLPLKEFELLTCLAEHAGKVLTREALIDRVWGINYVGDTKTLDVHIKRLRHKLEQDPSNPQHITTIRGLGYKFVPEP